MPAICEPAKRASRPSRSSGPDGRKGGRVEADIVRGSSGDRPAGGWLTASDLRPGWTHWTIWTIDLQLSSWLTQTAIVRVRLVSAARTPRSAWIPFRRRLGARRRS